MKKDPKYSITELNRYDRKILDKYTKFYTNFIESNTVKTDILKNDGSETGNG
ncbi:MAG: hypothetical protein Q8920_03540 [Bacillota bacterium]|nr:hypothetical protein [Bacillota bacterium]